jgi:phospholipid/cholesterol/gamma-HCH transport system substrate-binding protein
VNGKTKYVLMGLFVVALTFTFIAGVLWLSAGTAGRDYRGYLTYMQESVSGLSRDNAVKYQGVDVGRVREIGFDPARVGEVRLLLQIEVGTPIREDTVATLETQGLTGLAFINLTGGSAESPMLRAGPGEPLPVIQSRHSTWGRLDRAVEELVAEMTDVSRLFKVLLREENQEKFNRTLQHLEQLTGSLAGRSESMASAVDDLAVAARHTREASTGLPQLVEQLQSTATALEVMAEQVRATGVTVSQVVQARDRDLQQFTGESLPEAAVVINELRQAAGNLRRFSDQLQRDPSVLLRGRPPRPAGPGE